MQPSSPYASTSKQLLGSPTAHTVSPQAGTTNGRAREVRAGTRPRVLFMGPRSGGKSSIRKVVFERMAPSDTLFIEKTTKSSTDDFNSFISIDIFDLPGGQLDPEQWSISFESIDAIIFVLDAQSTFHDMIRKLAITMDKAYTANQGIQFEIFLHKIDGMSEDYRLDTLQNLRDRLMEDLFDISPELESSMNVFYHLTSVFDTSIYEALSKVIQKLIPEQAMLERLLDLLCQQCSMDKAFLFDTSSKIYIATDSAPLDNQTYIICSDFMDLIGDFSLLYESAASTYHSRSSSVGSRSNTLSPLTKSERNSSELPPIVPVSASTGTNGSPVLSGSSTRVASPAVGNEKDSFAVSDGTEREPARRLSSSKVELETGATIAQWGINSDLSLVALVRPNMMEQHSALIDYNVATLRDAVLAIFSVGMGRHS